MTGHASADDLRLDLATGDPAAEDTIEVRRRRFLQSGAASLGSLAIAMASGTVGAHGAPTRPARSVDTGKPVHLAKERLDALAEKFYAVFNEHGILPAYPAAKYAARYDVELRRLSTITQVPETGERVEVSGLLAVPVGRKGRLPVLSWQHGTILSFDQVPSNLMRLADPAYEPADNTDSLETLFNIHRFVGNGFALVAADYLGKGPYRGSRGEAYAVKDATVRCCLDILNAGMRELTRRGLDRSALFLNGWSQGALNTQWLAQEAQRRGIRLTAAAAQSPFNNLVEALHFWVSPTSYIPAADTSYPKPPIWITPCIIVLLGSYRLQYGLNDLFKTAIKPQHVELAEKFWADYRTDGAFAQSVPQPSDLLVEGFFARFTHDLNSKFLRRLAANSATYWDYRSPIRLYYGLADEALFPGLVTPALAGGGRFMEGVPVTGASHRGTFLASLYGDSNALNGHSTVPDWFSSML